MIQVTRTLNPIHFEDLEPHRFEDLVRQLAYDFRTWEKLEAVGRAGADGGVDILAFERLIGQPATDEDEFRQPDLHTESRRWIIQCKRYRRIGPSKVESILRDDIGQQDDVPHGYVLAAACEFSKKSRDRFRSVANEVGLQEFQLWGKGELEDMLFRPKNDHLLFAYFGISLQVRRRSLRTRARATIAFKKELNRILGGFIERPQQDTVLIRDPREGQYPEGNPRPIEPPRWRYWRFMGHQPHECLSFLVSRHLAYWNSDSKSWDAIEGHDDSIEDLKRGTSGVHKRVGRRDHWERSRRFNRYWQQLVAAEERAYLWRLAWIPYDRIIAIDELGDSYHPGPHLLVEYRDPTTGPFEPQRVELVSRSALWPEQHDTVRASSLRRVEFFPPAHDVEKSVEAIELPQRWPVTTS